MKTKLSNKAVFVNSVRNHLKESAWSSLVSNGVWVMTCTNWPVDPRDLVGFHILAAEKYKQGIDLKNVKFIPKWARSQCSSSKASVMCALSLELVERNECEWSSEVLLLTRGFSVWRRSPAWKAAILFFFCRHQRHKLVPMWCLTNMFWCSGTLIKSLSLVWVKLKNMFHVTTVWCQSHRRRFNPVSLKQQYNRMSSPYKLLETQTD